MEETLTPTPTPHGSFRKSVANWSRASVGVGGSGGRQSSGSGGSGGSGGSSGSGGGGGGGGEMSLRNVEADGLGTQPSVHAGLTVPVPYALD